MVPDQDFGPFRINPFKTWLVVVAVSGISYASYLLLKVVKGRGGIFLSGMLGGFYSSTITTVVLAKRAAGGAPSPRVLRQHPHRLGVHVPAHHGPGVAVQRGPGPGPGARLRGPGGPGRRRRLVLAPPARTSGRGPPAASQAQNPLELGTAFLFALLFVVIVMATHLALTYLGRGGIYSLAAIMGVTDVDPFIMGMTHEAGTTTSCSWPPWASSSPLPATTW